MEPGISKVSPVLPLQLSNYLQLYSKSRFQCGIWAIPLDNVRNHTYRVLRKWNTGPTFFLLKPQQVLFRLVVSFR